VVGVGAVADTGVAAEAGVDLGQAATPTAVGVAVATAVARVLVGRKYQLDTDLARVSTFLVSLSPVYPILPFGRRDPVGPAPIIRCF
jgi:hypothetical protein